MAFYDKFPYTNFQELNLDWVIQTVKELEKIWEEWEPTHEFKFADPIEWDGSRFYDIYTVVLGPDGNSYLSKTAVPPGVSLTDTNYWQKIFDAQAAIQNLDEQVTELQERYPRRTFYRPEQFGAVRDDSNVDCGPAIAQAINEAIDNNGIVLLTEGIYYMDTPVAINKHPLGLYIIGTGAWSRDPFKAGGTMIWYKGIGAAIHFGNGLQNSILKDFTIYNSAAGTCLKLSNDLVPEEARRTTMSDLVNMRFLYQEKGVDVNNSAYFRIRECDFCAMNTNIANRIGIDLAVNSITTNEYTYIENTAVDNNGPVNYGGTLQSKAISAGRMTHLYLSNVDITDSDYGLYIDCTEYESGFIYADTLDIARARIGIYVDIDAHPLQQTLLEQLVYTAPNDVGADDRIIYVNKSSGALPYSARIKANNIAIRSGANQMDYWIDCGGTGNNQFTPSMCEFSFNTSVKPKVNYGITRQIDPNRSTFYNLTSTSDIDYNSITYSGIYPQRFNSDAPNGPGFSAILIVFAETRYSVQVAISINDNHVLSSRVYDSQNDTWTTWKEATPQ